MHGSRRASGGINSPLLPVSINSVLHSVDVPAVAGSKIGPALALHGDPARTTAWRLRIARREIGITPLAVRNGVIRGRCLALECSGRARWWQRLLFFKFGDFRRVGFGLGRLGRLFFVETLGRIHCLTLGDNLFFRHRDSGRTDQTHFRAAEVASDAAPAILSKLNEGRNANHHGDTRMHNDGIDEELPEALVLRIGDGGSHAY